MTTPDRKPFARLLFAHQRQVYGYILTLVPHRADADELFQETSVILWEKLDEYDPDRPFYTWACGVAFNVVRNWRTKQRRDRHVFTDAFVERLSTARIAEAPLLDARREALVDCLHKLPADDRDLVDAYYTKGQPVAALADRMGVTDSAIYKSLTRIRRALFVCINRAVDGEDA